MNTPELQSLKMAWLAAAEAGDTLGQQRILRDHPAEQEALIDFIAGYHATVGTDLADEVTPLPLTQRAFQRALERTFVPQLALSTLVDLRKQRSLSKVDAARGLRMSVDVWNKFETGAIELVSLSQRQLDRLAQFFQISIDQFGSLLESSQPTISLNRRQNQEAARSEQQGPQRQSFADAVARSTMSKEEKQFWLE
ncbi:MAG TPA: helix-turn-helix transcriptional regulator [Ktedonobacteraceae bacterium]|jgi:transcriptional regulator with XRE-family HTH domain|nr:helix-turn-helix transcriptional regulator [Ktedonobacteraceae bacterium]